MDFDAIPLDISTGLLMEYLQPEEKLALARTSKALYHNAPVEEYRHEIAITKRLLSCVTQGFPVSDPEWFEAIIADALTLVTNLSVVFKPRHPSERYPTIWSSQGKWTPTHEAHVAAWTVFGRFVAMRAMYQRRTAVRRRFGPRDPLPAPAERIDFYDDEHGPVGQADNVFILSDDPVPFNVRDEFNDFARLVYDQDGDLPIGRDLEWQQLVLPVWNALVVPTTQRHQTTLEPLSKLEVKEALTEGRREAWNKCRSVISVGIRSQMSLNAMLPPL